MEFFSLIRSGPIVASGREVHERIIVSASPRPFFTSSW